MRRYSLIATKLLNTCDGWIVGSDSGRDLDILIPYHRWQQAACLIPTTAKPTSLGGWKFEDEGKVVDVWPMDLSAMVLQPGFMVATHFASGTVLTKTSLWTKS